MEERAAPVFSAVSAGGEHSLLTAKNGTLFACGRGDGGRLGLGPATGKLVRDDNGVTHRVYSDSLLATEVSVSDCRLGVCGEYHSSAVCVDAGGRDVLLSWGCGAVGQLGHPNSLDDVCEPQVVDYVAATLQSNAPCTITHVSLGDGHTLVALSDGSAHGFGNNELGVLGTTGGGGGGCVKHSERYGFAVRGASRQQPTLLPGLNTHKVVQVATSTRHSLLVTSAGDVLACGDNGAGQLGLGKALARSSIARRTPLRTSEGKAIKAAAGAEHSLVLLDDHTVVVCGSNRSGELGLGETIAGVDTFTPLVTPFEIADIGAGAAHSVLLDVTGKVLVCGWGECGSLGMLHLKNVYDITPSPFPAAWSRPVSVSCSSHHTLLLLEDGTVAVAGSNGHGQLGLGHNQKEVSEWAKITQVRAFREKHVTPSRTDTSCGAVEETTALDVLSRNFEPRIRSCPEPLTDELSAE